MIQVQEHSDGHGGVAPRLVIQIIAQSDTRPQAQALQDFIRHASPQSATYIRETALSTENSGQTLCLLKSPVAHVANAIGRGKPAMAAVDDWLSITHALLAMASASRTPVRLLDADRTTLRDALAALEQVLPLPDDAPDLDEPLPGSSAPDPALLHAAAGLCTTRHDVMQALDSLAGIGLRFPASDAATATAATPPATRTLHFQRDAIPATPESTLRACLADAQQELEDAYLGLRDLQSQIRSGLGAGSGGARAGHVRPVAVTPTSLRLELRTIQFPGQRSLARLELHLLLADGQPVLRIFATGEAPEVIQAWRADGEDAGLEYMQFQPTRAEDRRRLQFLGAADWQVVAGLTALIARQVPDLGEAVTPAVALAARRLLRQLNELPPRFRYDALSVATDPDGTTTIRFAAAGFGQIVLGDVALRWSGEGLRWCRDAAHDDAPLAGWPMDDAGVPAPDWRIPVADGRTGAQRREAWRELTDNDKAMVLAVLDALPGAARLAGESFKAPAARRDELARLAPAWLRQGQAAASGHVRRLARLPIVGQLFRG